MAAAAQHVVQSALVQTDTTRVVFARRPPLPSTKEAVQFSNLLVKEPGGASTAGPSGFPQWLQASYSQCHCQLLSIHWPLVEKKE